MEDKMSEIKKGDWVYYGDGHEEQVFQCDKIWGGLVKAKINIAMRYRLLKYCHRLEPLKRGDKLEGDRVAVIERGSNIDPDIGTIHRIIDPPLGYECDSPRIDFTPEGWFMRHCELARLPDCAQDKRPGPADTKKETHWADDVHEYLPPGSLRDCYYCGAERSIGLRVGYYAICESCATLLNEEREEIKRCKDDQPIPYVLTSGPVSTTSCPNPKYDGSTWDYCGEGFKIYWKNNKWTAYSIKPSGKWNPSFPVHFDPSELDEEDGFWKLIEYGCHTLESPVKLKKNVSFGWDPYGLG